MKAQFGMRLAVGVVLSLVMVLAAWAEGPSPEPGQAAGAQATSATPAQPARPAAEPETKVVIKSDTPFLEKYAPPPASDQTKLLTPEQMEWFHKIQALAVGPMSSPSMTEFREGESQLLQIKEPRALEPMALALYTPNTRWRSSFVKAAEQYAKSGVEPANKLAVTYLSDIAVSDGSAVLRGKARSVLMAKDTPRATERLKYQLAAAPDAQVRGRAAALLMDLKDETAIANMIEVLTTDEYRLVGADVESRSVQMDIRATNAGQATFRTVPVQAAAGAATATTFIELPTIRMTDIRTTVSAPAGFVITPDWQQVTVTHAPVLAALRGLTGKDFGYDKGAWYNWLRDARGVSGGGPPPAYGVDWNKP